MNPSTEHRAPASPRSARRGAPAAILPADGAEEDEVKRGPPGRQRYRKPGQREWSNRFAPGSLEELHHARGLAAYLMGSGYEWLRPLFERLHQEVLTIERADSAMDLAKRFAEQFEKARA